MITRIYVVACKFTEKHSTLKQAFGVENHQNRSQHAKRLEDLHDLCKKEKLQLRFISANEALIIYHA